MKSIIEYLKNPYLIVLALGRRGFFNWMSDKNYISLIYRAEIGYWMDLNNPKTFNEKTQWLKINDRKEIYTELVDKYLVKEYMGKIIGEEYIIPTLGVWDKPEDIDFDKLPSEFVLKCNHNSGLGMYICKDKNSINKDDVVNGLRKGIREDYFLTGREWPYKNVKRKIIAEKYIVDESGFELKDYKMFCFNGKVYFIQVDYDRFTNHNRNFYDVNWNYVPFTTLYPTNPNRQIERPKVLERMIDISETICKELSTPAFLRVDLYCVGDQIYFGETTFYHGSGYEKFAPPEYDMILGNMIKL